MSDLWRCALGLLLLAVAPWVVIGLWCAVYVAARACRRIGSAAKERGIL